MDGVQVIVTLVGPHSDSQYPITDLFQYRHPLTAALMSNRSLFHELMIVKLARLSDDVNHIRLIHRPLIDHAVTASLLRVCVLRCVSLPDIEAGSCVLAFFNSCVAPPVAVS